MSEQGTSFEFCMLARSPVSPLSKVISLPKFKQATGGEKKIREEPVAYHQINKPNTQKRYKMFSLP